MACDDGIYVNRKRKMSNEIRPNVAIRYNNNCGVMNFLRYLIEYTTRSSIPIVNIVFSSPSISSLRFIVNAANDYLFIYFPVTFKYAVTFEYSLV